MAAPAAQAAMVTRVEMATGLQTSKREAGVAVQEQLDRTRYQGFREEMAVPESRRRSVDLFFGMAVVVAVEHLMSPLGQEVWVVEVPEMSPLRVRLTPVAEVVVGVQLRDWRIFLVLQVARAL